MIAKTCTNVRAPGELKACSERQYASKQRKMMYPPIMTPIVGINFVLCLRPRSLLRHRDNCQQEDHAEADQTPTTTAFWYSAVSGSPFFAYFLTLRPVPGMPALV